MAPEEALAALVAGEDAAVYGYGVVAAHVSGEGRTRALTILQSHRARALAWRGVASSLGASAPPAAAAYELPFEVDSDPTARTLAADMEQRLAALYAQASSALDDRAQRKDAILGARECATRAVVWGADSEAFPG